MYGKRPVKKTCKLSLVPTHCALAQPSNLQNMPKNTYVYEKRPVKETCKLTLVPTHRALAHPFNLQNMSKETCAYGKRPVKETCILSFKPTHRALAHPRNLIERTPPPLIMTVANERTCMEKNLGTYRQCNATFVHPRTQTDIDDEFGIRCPRHHTRKREDFVLWGAYPHFCESASWCRHLGYFQ